MTLAMTKGVHTAAVLILLLYIALVAFNLPPLVRSNHVSMNWNLLFISGLGFLLAIAYSAVALFFGLQYWMRGAHVAVLCMQAIVLIGIASRLLFRALSFFGIV